MNQTELIKAFIEDGLTEGFSGNAKIENNQLIHFDTPILERNEKGFVFNASKYSDVTRFFQNKIKAYLNCEYIEVKRVAMGYTGSLKDFVEEDK